MRFKDGFVIFGNSVRHARNALFALPTPTEFKVALHNFYMCFFVKAGLFGGKHRAGFCGHPKSKNQFSYCFVDVDVKNYFTIA